jgi:hypothetical protein
MTDFRREIEPPSALEDRVVTALRDRGHLAPSSRWRRARVVAAAAAAVLLFLSGYAIGASSSAPMPTAADGSARFLLLLHETPATATTGVPEPQLVEEYRQWARGVSAGGTAIQGEKLKDTPGQTLSGFFIVAAPTREAADAIAASCPHARYGGRIEVREIDPT